MDSLFLVYAAGNVESLKTGLAFKNTKWDRRNGT
jgi:hypothetical protein